VNCSVQYSFQHSVSDVVKLVMQFHSLSHFASFKAGSDLHTEFHDRKFLQYEMRRSARKRFLLPPVCTTDATEYFIQGLHMRKKTFFKQRLSRKITPREYQDQQTFLDTHFFGWNGTKDEIFPVNQVLVIAIGLKNFLVADSETRFHQCLVHSAHF